MSTKAETLVVLSEYQKKINIVVPKIFYFSKKEYLLNKNKILKNIKKIFVEKKIILRSSSQQEDQENSSNAGKFKSFQNLNPNSTSINEKILTILEDFNNSNDQ